MILETLPLNDLKSKSAKLPVIPEETSESLVIHLPAKTSKKKDPVSYQKQICAVRIVCLCSQAFSICCIPILSVNAHKHFSQGHNTIGAVLTTLAVVNACAIFTNRKIWGELQKNYASCEKGYTGKRTLLDNLIFFPG
jgi:hypothetical protein